MTLPKFAIDAHAATYEALAYGALWNGWATPIVTRETFRTLIDDQDPQGDYFTLSFDSAGVATFIETNGEGDTYVYVLDPNADGGYDLGEIGWCFNTVQEEKK